MKRHRAILLLTYEELLGLLTGGISVLRTHLPEDVTIVQVEAIPKTQEVEVYLESAAFAPSYGEPLRMTLFQQSGLIQRGDVDNGDHRR
jgi:hypothetical protein